MQKYENTAFICSGPEVGIASLKMHGALQGDVTEARRRCLGLVRQGFRPAWELAAQLALLGRGRGTGGAQYPAAESKDLLGFAIAHCNPDQVPFTMPQGSLSITGSKRWS